MAERPKGRAEGGLQGVNVAADRRLRDAALLGGGRLTLPNRAAASKVNGVLLDVRSALAY